MAPESQRLKYRRADSGDAAFLDTLAASEDVRQFIGGLPVPGNEAAATLFILERENVPVGWGGFVRSQALDGQEMELICAIIPACRRENLATEACGALVTWALESRLWPRILACVHCSNERGLALASRLGFREIGRRVSDPSVRVLERAAG